MIAAQRFGFIALLSLLSLEACTERQRDAPEMSQDRTLSEVSWITEELVDSVRSGIEESVRMGEVPIGAALVVGTESGRKIFVGSNSVQRHAAGHAEVNALQLALDRLGPGALENRDSLWLVTSFEPCPMCAALLGDIHGIHPDHVSVMQRKLPEWSEDEQLRVVQMQKGWTFFAVDSVQGYYFCQDDWFRGEYPELCP